MTYNVFGGTLNLALSLSTAVFNVFPDTTVRDINPPCNKCCDISMTELISLMLVVSSTTVHAQFLPISNSRI